MSDPSERSFSLRHIVVVALPAFVLMLALTGVYWWHLLASGDSLRRATIQNAQLRAEQVNDALSVAVSMLFFNADEAIQSLVAFYQPRKVQEFNEQARVLTQRFPQGSVLQVAVIGPDGYLEYSNLGMKEKPYLGDREHFSVHQDKPGQGLFISKPLMGKVSGKWSIQFSRRIERNGRFAGVMVLSLSPDFLYQNLSRLAQAPNDVFQIMRSTGEIMARNRDMEKSIGLKSSQPSPYDQATPGQSGSYTAPGTIDQVERLYQWQHLPDYPVIVVLGQSMKGLMAPVEKAILQERIKGILSTLATWICAGLAVVLTLRVQTNIRRRVEFEYAALHDALTGLRNRKALQDHLDRQIEKTAPDASAFGLLFIDLDDFKQINDLHGHTAGDTVLKTVASRLRQCARGSDLLARIGGDEFVVVCHDLQHPDDMKILVGRIRHALDQPMGIGPEAIHVGASIGVALYPEDGMTTTQLLDAADRDMYSQKFDRKSELSPPGPGQTPASAD